MSLTANTASTAAAVDTTVITKRYSGELESTGSGTTNLTLYTCPADKIAYVYFQSFYMYTFSNGKWHFYIGSNAITQSTMFPGTIFYYSNSSNTFSSAYRIANDKFIVSNSGSNYTISVGLAKNDTLLTSLTYGHSPLYSSEYSNSYTWQTNGSNYISQILPSRIIINPNNQLKYTHEDSSNRIGFWDFIVEEHAYVAPT